MTKLKIGRAIVAGFIATMIITIFLFTNFALGGSDVGVFSQVLPIFSQHPPPLFSHSWWGSLLWHLNFGTIVFPHVFLIAFFPIAPGKAWQKGALWGASLWLLSESVVMPIIGAGFFSGLLPNQLFSVLSGLALHVVYGTTLGAVIGESRADEISLTEYERRAA